jgi:hypothetical protein
LDPHISYNGLKDEFADDSELLFFLEFSKEELHSYYKKHYADCTSFESIPPSHTPAIINGSPQKNFTARFQKNRAIIDELLEFWKLPQEDFDACQPIQWWFGRRSMFPHLYRLACDILSIPGEHYLSGPFLLLTFLPRLCGSR